MKRAGLILSLFAQPALAEPHHYCCHCTVWRYPYAQTCPSAYHPTQPARTAVPDPPKAPQKGFADLPLPDADPAVTKLKELMK